MEYNKYTNVECNEKLIEVYTVSLVGNSQKDPLGEDIFFDSNIDLKTLGNAVVKSLAKSRDLSISNEDMNKYSEIKYSKGRDAAEEWFYQRFPEWKLFDLENDIWKEKNKFYWENIERIYKSRSHTAISRKVNQNMQIIDVEKNVDYVKFTPTKHERYGWGGIQEKEKFEVIIPSTSSSEVIGAAVKYAIGNCRGKGADLIRSLLFPNGQPETFEKYIEELGIG